VARSESSRKAQVEIGSLTLSLSDLQSAPFAADPASGGSPTAVRTRIRADETAISRGLAIRSEAGVPDGLLAAGRARLRSIRS
jgi:hypothetical protein